MEIHYKPNIQTPGQPLDPVPKAILHSPQNYSNISTSSADSAQDRGADDGCLEADDKQDLQIRALETSVCDRA